MPMLPVDTSMFQFGVVPDPDPEYDETDERRGLDELAARAMVIVREQPWAPPVHDILLAFGIGPIFGLYLVRFAHPFNVHNGDSHDEIWLVLGDVPTIFISTDANRTRADAIRAYCDLAEAWAHAALDGGDVSECYDMQVEPTPELARMLRSRATRIRERFIPYVEGKPCPMDLDS